MASNLITTEKIKINHYLTNDAYKRHKQLFSNNDIGIIGKQMLVYSTDEVDGKMSAFVGETREKAGQISTEVKQAKQDVDKRLNTIDQTMCTKLYADSTFQKKGNYLTSIPKEYVTNTILYQQINDMATKTYTDGTFVKKGEFQTQISQKANEKNVYSKSVVDNKVLDITREQVRLRDELTQKMNNYVKYGVDGKIDSKDLPEISSVELREY